MTASSLSAGLYHPRFEHDGCGFGLIARMDERPSRWLVETAISSLTRLSRRGGAIAADGKTGDGCDLLLKKPHAFLSAVASEHGFTLAPPYAAGMIFLHRDEALDVLGWREVPIDASVCGRQALESLGT